MPDQAQCILAALAKSDRDYLEWETVWDRLWCWSTANLQPAISGVECEYQEAAKKQRQRRKDTWFKWVTEALEDGGGRIGLR